MKGISVETIWRIQFLFIFICYWCLTICGGQQIYWICSKERKNNNDDVHHLKSLNGNMLHLHSYYTITFYRPFWKILNFFIFPFWRRIFLFYNSISLASFELFLSSRLFLCILRYILDNRKNKCHRKLDKNL